jgi:hypothetical protein
MLINKIYRQRDYTLHPNFSFDTAILYVYIRCILVTGSKLSKFTI